MNIFKIGKDRFVRDFLKFERCQTNWRENVDVKMSRDLEISKHVSHDKAVFQAHWFLHERQMEKSATFTFFSLSDTRGGNLT